jgi:hypothetical protein
MSGGPPSVEGYDSADATFNEALQIDMKGLFGDTVGNVSDPTNAPIPPKATVDERSER